MTGSNPTDRSKLGTKRHILTDAKGIPLSVAMSSASTHDIKLVTDVMDNVIVKRSYHHHQQRNVTCLGEGNCNTYALTRLYNSKTVKQEIISRGYVPHMLYKRKRGEVRTETQKMSNRKYILPEDG